MESTDEQRAETLAERLFGAYNSYFDVVTVYIGDRLGLYGALEDGGAQTAGELAARTETTERYVREWLEQQAVTGLLAVDDALKPEDERRYSLPGGHEQVLLRPDSPLAVVALARAMVGVNVGLPRVIDAFRTGAGVSYRDYGLDGRMGLAEGNRPMFVNQLAEEWIPAIPDVHARLRADPPARILDIGCGTGWSAICLARGYPNARVIGLDLDEEAISIARTQAEAEGVADRVTFEARNAGDPGLEGGFDVAFAFECIHDMSRPVEALRAARDLLAADGTMIVADERVQEAFGAPGDDVERFNYGWSVTFCLPTGMEEQPSAATGTAMRPDTLRRYASDAGFARTEILPIDHDFWRFYRLHP